jgi:plasmid stabilization system protein ParE
LAALEAFCEDLVDTLVPRRPCDEIGEGLFRAQHISHVVFYRLTSDGVRVVRILHGSQEPRRQSFEDDDA